MCPHQCPCSRALFFRIITSCYIIVLENDSRKGPLEPPFYLKSPYVPQETVVKLIRKNDLRVANHLTYSTF